jgi:hypothetical protein
MTEGGIAAGLNRLDTVSVVIMMPFTSETMSLMT